MQNDNHDAARTDKDVTQLTEIKEAIEQGGDVENAVKTLHSRPSIPMDWILNP